MTTATSPRRPVLVVDDDEVLREALCELLEECGYPVYRATQGADALALLLAAPEPPGLILLDLAMPVMDGWETLERLGRDESLARIPVALLSASPRASAHAGHVVTKPIRLEVLIGMLEEHCGPPALPARVEGALLEVGPSVVRVDEARFAVEGNAVDERELTTYARGMSGALTAIGPTSRTQVIAMLRALELSERHAATVIAHGVARGILVEEELKIAAGPGW